MSDYSVSVDGIVASKNIAGKNTIQIYWHGSMGYGEYNLIVDGNKIQGQSECMDKGDDKSFLKALLNDLADKVEVVE